MANDAFGNPLPTDPTAAPGTVTTPAAGTTPQTSTPGFNLAAMQKPTDWAVDPKTQTVSGQLESVIAADSPLMQQARSRALQTMNSRGLANSSMAVGAADAAMYDAAMPIATANAATYANAAKSNTDTANTFTQAQNSYNFDMGKLTAQTKAATDVAGIEAQYKNLTQGSASATSIVNKMQDSLNALMANKDITDQTKRDALAADIKANASESLNLIGALAGDVDLSSYISQVGL
jgi:hypothetical protein